MNKFRLSKNLKIADILLHLQKTTNDDDMITT